MKEYNYLPKNEEDLLNKMKENKFKGEYFLKNNIIYWNINSAEQIQIILNNQGSESYVSFSNSTHDHVEVDEIWKYLESINNEVEN